MGKGIAPVCFSLLFAAALSAQSTTWTGNATNSWNNNANWTAGIPTQSTAVIIPSTANYPSTAGVANAVCASLTIQAGGSLQLANTFPLSVFGSVSNAGSIFGTPLLRLRGTGTIDTSGTGTMPATEIFVGPYTITSATFSGNLNHLPSAAAITVQNAVFQHDANFQGAGLIGTPGSSLTVTDTMLVQCTVPVTTPPSTIHVRGVWTSSSCWQPTSGEVTFDGTVGPTINVAPNTHWWDLRLAVAGGFNGLLNSDLLVNGALHMGSGLSVTGTRIDLAGSAGLSFGVNLLGANVTALTLHNGLLSAGAIVTPNAVLTASGNVNLFATGLLQVGAGHHTFADSLTVSGVSQIITSGSAPTNSIEFTGAGNITVQPGGPLPDVRITGTNYTIRSAAITGSLLQTAGTLNIERCFVAGAATFQGANVQNIASGVLDVSGPLSWQTTGVVANPPARIVSRGGWTSNANFAPVAGLVVFANPGPQTVNVAAFTWSDLRIDTGTTVSTTLPVVVNGFLDVLGTLTTTGPSVTVTGPLTVAGALQAANASTLTLQNGLTVGGTLQASNAVLALHGDASIAGSLGLGSGSHVLWNSLVVTGAITVPGSVAVQFQGSGVVDVALGSQLPAASFNGGAYDVQSLRLANDLNLVSGALSIHRCDVGGNASLLGSQVLDLATGTLHVLGNVNWQTTTSVQTPPATIRCGGNWTASAAFAPTSGLVEFDGSGAQLVTMPTFQWFNLRIGALTTVNTAQAATILGFLDVQGSLTVGGASVQTAGALTIGAGATLAATTATSLLTGGSANIAGSLTMGNAVLAATGDFTVTATGACVLGNGAHTLSANFRQSGALLLPPTSTVRFLGTGQVDAVATHALPAVTFAGGTHAVTNLTVAGALTQTAGRVQIASMHVLGNATFQGTTLEDDDFGTLAVDGNLILQTSNAVVHPPSTIQCRGNFTANSQFLPGSGRVVMAGSSPQVMTAPIVSLANLEVVAGSQVSFATTDVILEGDLICNGQISATSGGTDVRGSLTVGSAGALLIPASGNCAVAGSCTNAGSIQSSQSLAMTGTGTLSGGGVFPGVQVESLGEVSVAGAVVLGADMSLRSGSLRLLSAASLLVQGDLKGSGGSLRGIAGSTLTINGNAMLNGVQASALGMPTIHCTGNWQARSTFAPISGTVFFAGPGSLTATDGTLNFHDLVATTGLRTLTSSAALHAQTVQLANGSELRVGQNQLDLTAATVTVDGSLALAAGSRLFLGTGTALTVTATGALHLLGTWASPAIVDGPLGGAYSFRIQGAIEAVNYEFHHMGANGVEITPTAVIAAAPRDLRGGLFADGDVGGCLLQVERSALTEFRYLRFTNSPATATANVKAPATSAPIHLINEGGAFAGAANESDPGNVIFWETPQRTTLASQHPFRATAAVHRAELSFTTTAEIDVLAFHLLRSEVAAGPFTEIPGSPFPIQGTTTSGYAYARTDTLVVDTTRYFYRLEEELQHGEMRLLGSDFARPWPQSIGNTLFVGTGGGYADIATAVTAALPSQTIVVQAGTYAASVIDKPVRLVPDGSGEVVIDTTLSRFSIRNIPAGSFDVMISGLTIGLPGSLNGMDVQNCGNIVVLDQLNVRTAAGTLGIDIDGSGQVAMQGCTVPNAPALKVQNSSLLYLSRGALGSLDVQSTSTVNVCDITPGSVTTAPGATTTVQSGVMPDMQFPAAWHGNKSVPFTITAQPTTFYGVILSVRRDYLDLSLIFPIDMVLLIDPTQMVTLASGITSPTGEATLNGLTAPGIAGGWGSSVPLQLLQMNFSGQGRMGTTRDVIFLP